MLRWLLASIHLIALGLGLGAVWARGLALRAPERTFALERAFYADTLWGIAALLWIVTGVARAFTGLEKGADYYLHNGLFHAKMGALLLILALEVRPMVTLIRWRMRAKRGEPVDTAPARGFARISFLQALLIVLMVFLAAGMARGFGAG